MEKVLEPGEEPLHYRAASYLLPTLEDDHSLPFVRTHKDLLLHLLFKQAADTFLKQRYKVNISVEDWAKTPESVRELVMNQVTSNGK
jgi:pyruvate/oxaloacetate carboxyltransferase